MPAIAGGPAEPSVFTHAMRIGKSAANLMVEVHWTLMPQRTLFPHRLKKRPATEVAG